jgi:hypothetical protein
MEEHYDSLLNVLCSSMESVEEKFIKFEVACIDDPIQRERAYCYELYHQIRNRHEQLTGGYTVNPEPNKKNHPIIEDHCGPVDPDFIVHNNGKMGAKDNLAVIEVKTSNGDLTTGINKDIDTINCMTSIENGYFGGIIIVYGELTELRKKNLEKRIKDTISENINKMTLVLQNAPNEEALRITIK